ncbi:hypothetical protein [Streptomyces sp. NPDC007264]|uniref:hypothetical protein n=1 Tax=Streptomyces sp. NPDC007264 TaxID=3364777 RepID=UPI0036DCCB52
MITSTAWQRELTAAFSVLLGGPLESFDPAAEYALYYRNTIDRSMLFELLDDVGQFGRVLSPSADGGRPQALKVCLGLDWGLDLARSEFELCPDDGTAFARALDSLPDTAFLDRHRTTLPGRELARLLPAHGLGPADIVSASEDGTLDVGVTLRVATDGTLRDAMVTATRSAAGPDGLRPGPEEAAVLSTTDVFTFFGDQLSPAAAAERDRLLAPVGDPRLRAHIWSPYLDMPWDRAEDGTVVGTPAVRYRSVADRPGTAVVAAWDLSYFGEISLAVVQTGGSGR